MGVKIYPQADLFTVISDRLGVKTSALVNCHKCVWAMKWHHPGKFLIIHNSKMAASKLKIIIYYTILDLVHCIFASVL